MTKFKRWISYDNESKKFSATAVAFELENAARETNSITGQSCKAGGYRDARCVIIDQLSETFISRLLTTISRSISESLRNRIYRLPSSA